MLTMSWNIRIISSVVAIASACVATAAAYYCKARKSDINEVMIFSKLQYNVCNYFDRLIAYVENAKHSVSICMPGIHNAAIQGRLVQLVKTNRIKVQIIIEKSGYNEWNAVFLEELKDAGAEIKWQYGDFTMHHKYCLIDQNILMTGTLNWGDDMSADDWNYVLITTRKHLVEPVTKQFEHLWKTCDASLL